jgi:hypothetical protein
MKKKYIKKERQGETQKVVDFDGFLSLLSFFFLSVSTAATYIFTAPICTATIILLEPCALNAEFQQFIMSYNNISLLYGYH